MRVRWSRLRKIVGVAILALVIAVAAAAGDTEATGAPPTASPGCDRPFSTTLLETAKVRLYAMPKESTAHPEHHNPAIAGRPVFGCLESSGRSRLLDLPELGGEKNANWVEVDSRTVAANGPLVAYAYTQYYLDTHETWVRVRNLNTGAVIRDCLVGGSIAPRRGPHVTDIVLGSNGEVGWNAEGEETGTSDSHLPGCNPLA